MTTITISGAGSTINFEVEIIKRALEAEGIIVEVKNDFPNPDIDNMISVIRERLSGNWGKDHDQPPIKKYVRIVAEHIPWGG